MDRKLLSSFTRRSALTASALAALGGITLAPAAAQEATPTASEEPHRPVFLFVQLAEAGSWTPKADTPGVYTLRLSGVSGQTLFFSDRPDRIVGTVPIADFLEGLGFTPHTPPNAAAVVETPEGARDVLVIELWNPVLSQTFGDDATISLQYDARVLETYEGDNLTVWHGEQQDAELPSEFSNVSLFIDDCADMSNCWYIGETRAHTVGPLPGGPVETCWDSPAGWGCTPCLGKTYYDQRVAECNAAYPDECMGQCMVL
ncbi:MAG: hypothetical protein M9947_11730 [Thermomicrobiales bacterium]|nr:hypothetical protein [Thermomicrobiales bacterium]